MKLFILGANGHTGTQVIDLALARAHEVTAFVRSPEKIRRRHPLLKVVRGDPHNVDELAIALRDTTRSSRRSVCVHSKRSARTRWCRSVRRAPSRQ